jgi:lipopolysaccharide/colanic/teichoic acid biosynthesis glycosyltransferase
MMIKRCMDIGISLVGIVILWPLFLFAAILVRRSGPGPILFRQERVGMGFRPFIILKFRTMADRAAGSGPAVTSGGDPRVTPAGRFLRRTKLDELPQLFNVLKGDMSLVGPRPEVPRYTRLRRAEYEEILTVRPGITDYASLEYRDEEEILRHWADPEEGYLREVLPAKLALSRRYLREKGILTDLKLLSLTVAALLRPRRG